MVQGFSYRDDLMTSESTCCQLEATIQRKSWQSLTKVNNIVVSKIGPCVVEEEVRNWFSEDGLC